MFKLWMWERLFTDFSIFLAGFGMTLVVSLLALVLTLLISLTGGLVRCSHARIAKNLLWLYMSLFQNTPLVVQIFFFYYVLPRMGVVLSPFSVGCLGLALYTGAFGIAVVEASILAIPKQQSEAAMSQGFSYLQTMSHVIIPQAMKIALPSLTNQAVNLIKNSSVLAMIAGGDLMYRTDSWASETAVYGPTFLVTGLLYLSICLPLSRLVKTLESKVR